MIASVSIEALIEGLRDNYATPEGAVQQAQALARSAHRKAEALRRRLLNEPAGDELLIELVDPLLRCEREMRALRERIRRGGPRRAGDTSLEARLERCGQRFQELREELPWEELDRGLKIQVYEYVEARRREVRLGDAENVRRQTALAV